MGDYWDAPGVRRRIIGEEDGRVIVEEIIDLTHPKCPFFCMDTMTLRKSPDAVSVTTRLLVPKPCWWDIT